MSKWLWYNVIEMASKTEIDVDKRESKKQIPYPQ